MPPTCFLACLDCFETSNIIPKVIGCLSIAMLTLNEFHPATSKQVNVAERLLVISVFAGLTPIMIASTLLLDFEGYTSVTGIIWLEPGHLSLP